MIDTTLTVTSDNRRTIISSMAEQAQDRFLYCRMPHRLYRWGVRADDSAKNLRLYIAWDLAIALGQGTSHGH